MVRTMSGDLIIGTVPMEDGKTKTSKAAIL